MEGIHGGDIYTYEPKIDFSANINPLGPPKRVIEAIQKSILLSDHYPDVSCRKLRRSLMEAEQVPVESILCGNGAADLIFQLVLSEKPKRAVLAVPAFAEYEQALETAGCEILYYRMKEETGFQIQRDYLDFLTEDVDMIFLCTPNNPTGQMPKRELLLAILERCRENHIRMVMDECFIDFTDHPEESSMKEYLKAEELVILKAFTKFYALPGIRLGYALTSDLALIERMKKSRQPWSVSVPAQAGGIASLEEKDLPETVRAYVKRERNYLTQELSKLGIRFYPPAANFILLYSHKDLYHLLKERGYLIRDCSNYEGLTKGYYRIAVRRHTENKLLIKALGEIVRAGGNEDGKTDYDTGNHV